MNIQHTEIKIGNIDCSNQKKIVIIGKNGSGKSKELQRLKQTYRENIVLIPSARDIHTMTVDLTNISTHESNFDRSINSRGYVDNASTTFLSKLLNKDYVELNNLRQNNQHTSEGKNYITILNNILKKVSPQYPDITFEKFQIKNTGYDIKVSSDGEKQTIVLICAVLSAHENAILLIDEPENGLHNSALKVLFDELEVARPDCTFIYATHNTDFVKTREEAMVIYLSYGNEPKIMFSEDTFEKDLLIEMNGIPKPILLVEGDNTDKKLYSKIFKEYEVRNGGGCGKIKTQVNAVRTFFNRQDVCGLIDGDNKGSKKESELNKLGIFSIPLAQHEHLFIIPQVLKSYLGDIGRNDIEATKAIIDVIKDSSDWSRHDDEEEIKTLKTQIATITNDDDIVNFLKIYRGKDLIGKVESRIGVKNIQSNIINKEDKILLICDFIKEISQTIEQAFKSNNNSMRNVA